MLHGHHSIRYARCVHLEPHLESVICICSYPSMYTIYYTKYVHLDSAWITLCTPFFFLGGGGTSINPRAVLRLGEFQAKLCLRLAQRLGSGLDGSMVKTCQDSEEASRRIHTYDSYDYIYIYNILYMYNQIIAMTFRDQKKSAATRVLIWSSWLSEHHHPGHERSGNSSIISRATQSAWRL